MTQKRSDYISWDEYFMAVAQLSAQRSKDPGTQVGACIVNKNKRIIGIGYNGFPVGCSDDELPWSRDGEFLDTKYPYVCHAELNAVTNATNRADLDGASIYVSLFPCNECAKLIVQVGIREVVYLSDKYAGEDLFVAARRILDMAGVTCRQLITDTKDISLSLEGDD
jgi:dCMP deaminase